jgi:uncharacterized protein
MSGAWIQTYTGRQFWPLNPRVDDVCLEDIAHSLSMQCRFNGHCLRFYSVAEHTVRMVGQLRRDGHGTDVLRWALLHDAAEAYLSDVPRPVKRQIPEYGAAESHMRAVICAALGVGPSRKDCRAVRIADDRMLATEARDIMAAHPADWGLTATPYQFVIEADAAETRAWRDAFMEDAAALGLSTETP